MQKLSTREPPSAIPQGGPRPPPSAVDPRLLRHARATAPYIAATAAVGVATAVLVIVQAGLLASLISAGFLHGELRTGELIALAAVMAGRALLSWGQEAAAHRSSALVKEELRERTMAHAVRLGPAWMTGERSAELATLVVRGVDALDAYFSRYLPQLLLAVIVPVAVLARMAWADIGAAAIVAVTLPLIPIFMVLIGLHTKARAARQWRATAVLAGHFADVVAGLPTLRVFGRARTQAAKIAEVTGEHRRTTMATLRVAFCSALVLEIAATLSVALVAVSVGLRLVSGGLTLEVGLLLLILAPEAYLPLRMVGVHYHASAEGLAAADKIFKVLDASTPRDQGVSRDRDGGAVPRNSLITASGVAVTYPGRPTLRPVSLALEPGTVTALTGPSGCGKSTFLAVLLGFVPSYEGRVTVDGVELSSLDMTAWRRRITWMPQRPVLVPGSVEHNIALAVPDAPARAVRRARERAQAPGLNRPLGEDGSGTSAGERQRIALSRAFLRCELLGTPLLLLDEPTAHLDPETRDLVAAGLRDLCAGRTTLLVTHQSAMLDLAGREVVLS